MRGRNPLEAGQKFNDPQDGTLLIVSGLSQSP